MSATSPVSYDMTVIENRAPTVAAQFLDRVKKSPHREAYRYPRGRAAGSRRPGRRPGTTSPAWRRAWWRSASSRSSGSASPRAPASSGSSPTSRSCAPAARRRPSTRRRTPTTSATSWPTPSSRVVFAEDDDQVAKLTERRSELPHLDKVVTFDGTTDGDWVIGLADLEKLGEELLAKEPDVIEKRVDAIGPDALATLDLHLGHDRAPQGRAAAAHVVDLRGRGHPGAGHPRRERPAVPVAADGALVRQGAAVDASSRAASRRRSTAESTRSSTTSPSYGRRSWVRRRASSRRPTRASSRCRPPRAA